MVAIKYRVTLSEEVAMLEALLRKGWKRPCMTVSARGEKLNDTQCAHVIATACPPALDGHDHWELRLLADKVVQWG